MYICKYCGKEFEKQQSYASHIGKCKLNPNRDNALKHLSYARSCKQDDKEMYECKYCNKKCYGKNSLIQHEIRCSKNDNKIKIKSNFIKYNQDCKDGIKHHPHKGQTKDTCDSLRRGCETRKNKQLNDDYIHPFQNKQHTKETKEKMRISALNYLSNTKNVQAPRYNKNSIKYINALNEEQGWNLQHAENGGEFEICGYFVDGYDFEKNIVFEYDEPRHYIDVDKSILTDRDIERQNLIIEKLNCEFYRYNEKKDILYKINNKNIV